jgi:hypothetical protein
MALAVALFFFVLVELNSLFYLERYILEFQEIKEKWSKQNNDIIGSN